MVCGVRLHFVHNYTKLFGGLTAKKKLKKKERKIALLNPSFSPFFPSYCLERFILLSQILFYIFRIDKMLKY